MGNGWIKLHRQATSHWLYQKQPFDEWHAFEDILLLVNHEQNKFLHGNTLLTVERGQAVTSLHKLAARWGWKSAEKVKRFLTLLVSDGMLQVESDTNKTVITVANYDFYQSANENLLHNCDTIVTQTRTNKNDKKEKNDKKVIDDDDAREGWVSALTFTFGSRINPQAYEAINSYRESMTSEVIELAISIAALNSAVTPRYVERILSDWYKRRVHTLEDAQALAKDGTSKKPAQKQSDTLNALHRIYSKYAEEESSS